jgi:hypothetical protein
MEENKSVQNEKLENGEQSSFEFTENVTCKTTYTEGIMRSYRKFTDKSANILSMIMCAIFMAAAIALLISVFLEYSKES